MSNEEKSKNVKALSYTLVTCVVMVVILIFASWTLPSTPIPVVDNGIEVNLGNSDQGMGDIAPQLPGEPSADNQKQTDNPPPTVATKESPTEYKEVAENNEKDAPVIKTSPTPKKILKPKNKPIKKAVEKRIKHEVINKTPTPPSPKAVYKGGNNKGTGGNNADSYNGVSNQGVAGGNGDQGKVNGNPNSDNYEGNGGSGGISIKSGLNGRRFVGGRSFQSKFNENAKVAVDIIVNKAGKVTSASVNPRGTTTTNSTILGIARQKAKELKFNTGTVETQTGTIVFDFKLNG